MLVFNFRKILVGVTALQRIGQIALRVIAGAGVSCLIISGDHAVCAEETPLVVTAAPWQPEMTAGGPIAITIRMQNQSTAELSVNLGEDEKEGIQILATSDTGQRYAGTWKQKEGMSLIGRVKIGPASAAERVLILEDWNISLPPGRYNVLISFKYKISLSTGAELLLPPVEIRMEVVKRDSSRIKQECDSARSQYLNADSATQASTAANLLSKFKDPSALDCLTTVYDSQSPYDFGYLFIHAIADIGTDPAKRVLIDIANGNRKSDAQLAKSALQSIKNH